MKGLFWFGAGLALGTFGYRYYTANGGRFPFLEQWTGMSTDDMLEHAGGMMNQAGEAAQQTMSDTSAKVAKHSRGRGRKSAATIG